MHNSSFSRSNGPVNEGDQVALAGTTGLSTGPHVHWDINTESQSPTTFNSFIPPADWLAGKYQSTTPTTGGNNVFQTDAEIVEAYLMLRGVAPSASEIASWRGQSKQRFFQVGKPEADATRARLASAEKTVAALNVQVNQLNVAINQLKTQVASLTSQVKVLTESNTAKDKEIADLKAQVAAGGNGEDTQLLNGFGELLRKLIARLGLKG